MSKTKADSNDTRTKPVTIYGGVPGALSLFGLGFCLAFIVVFLQVTGDTVPLWAWLLFGSLSLFMFFMGMVILENRIQVNESSLDLSRMHWNLFFPPYLKIPWADIRKIDANQKNIKPGRYAPNQITLIQIFYGGSEKPAEINVTLFKSNPRWPVIRKTILGKVGEARVTESAGRILGRANLH